MPVDAGMIHRNFDSAHSKRRDRSRQGVKVPNDFRRGRKQGRR